MAAERSLEGWAPVIGVEATLEDVVDLAFEYRGDVTVVRTDGTLITGYLFNRDRHAPEPCLQLLAADGTAHSIRYADVAGIRFTGKDPAAGKSYEAWRRRRADGDGERAP